MSRPKTDEPAAGRVLMHEMRSIERYLHKRRVPPEEVRDIVCQAIVIVWEHIVTGRAVLPADPAEYGPALGRYLFGVVRGLVSNRRRAGEMMVRGTRAGLEDAPEGTARIEAAVELASELQAQPPSLRRFLLTLMGAGDIAETARQLRMSESAATEAMRRAREYASGERRAPRGKNRPKK